ncbi:hypothetical protein [Nocardia carnea]|uniref:hypothetical protein n=1 Tax=Nocardia carnea TaxID=37328 RepID=UPI0024559BA4|nr:hypothetical protein [Nocardia carnea]
MSVVEGADVAIDGRVVDGGVVVTCVVVVVVVVVGSFGSSSLPNRAPQPPPHKHIVPTMAPTTMRVLRLARLRRSAFAAC